MQLAVYFLLVEDDLRKSTAHGLIRYNNGSIQIENTDELRDELLGVVEEMRESLIDDDVGRSHEDARRCRACFDGTCLRGEISMTILDAVILAHSEIRGTTEREEKVKSLTT